MMNWDALWIRLFGTARWMGADISFWAALAFCLMVILIMNGIAWGIRPKDREKNGKM